MADIGKISGNGGKSIAIYEARIRQIQSVVSRLATIPIKNYHKTMINVNDTLTGILRFKTTSASASFQVTGPFDKEAGDVVTIKIKNLIKANDPKINIKEKAARYAFEMLKIMTVANNHNFFDLLQNDKNMAPLKMLFLSNVFDKWRSDQKDFATGRSDEIEQYQRLLIMLQAFIHRMWDPVVQKLMEKISQSR